jgi:hypothetical protein
MGNAALPPLKWFLIFITNSVENIWELGYFFESLNSFLLNGYPEVRGLDSIEVLFLAL